MGSRVLHVLYTYCARTCTRIFARRAGWVLDLPRLLSLSLSLSFGRYRTVPQGGPRALRHLATGCLLLPHTWPGCFLFLVPLLLLLSLGGFSLRVSLSFFLFMRSIKKGTRPSSLEESFRRVQPASSNPFTGGYVCAPREGLCGLSAATDTFNFFIRRSPSADPSTLIVMLNREDFIVSFNITWINFHFFRSK